MLSSFLRSTRTPKPVLDVKQSSRHISALCVNTSRAQTKIHITAQNVVSAGRWNDIHNEIPPFLFVSWYSCFLTWWVLHLFGGNDLLFVLTLCCCKGISLSCSFHIFSRLSRLLVKWLSVSVDFVIGCTVWLTFCVLMSLWSITLFVVYARLVWSNCTLFTAVKYGFQ